MSNLLNAGTVLGVTLVIGAIFLILFPYLKKKNVKVDEVLQKTDMVLDGVNTVVGVADKLLPGNPAVSILKTIEKYAHVAVNQAEQLYITSQLAKDQRNIKAKETIYSTLKLLNVEITPEVEKIIDGAIEAEVLALGHKDKSEEEKAAEKENLQKQLADVTIENNQLKQTLTQIQSTVSTFQ